MKTLLDSVSPEQDALGIAWPDIPLLPLACSGFLICIFACRLSLFECLLSFYECVYDTQEANCVCVRYCGVWGMGCGLFHDAGSAAFPAEDRSRCAGPTRFANDGRWNCYLYEIRRFPERDCDHGATWKLLLGPYVHDLRSAGREFPSERRRAPADADDHDLQRRRRFRLGLHRSGPDSFGEHRFCAGLLRQRRWLARGAAAPW